MPFQPMFMQSLPSFHKELGAVKTPSEWTAFRKRWFSDESSWPRKTTDQVKNESTLKRGPVQIAGCEWGFSSFAFDITPESRHEYFTASQIGIEILFPRPPGEKRSGEDGWTRHCFYDEIWTREVGQDSCPKCGRTLIFGLLAD